MVKKQETTTKDSPLIVAYQGVDGIVRTARFETVKQAKVFQSFLNDCYGSRQQTRFIYLDD